MAIKNKSQKAPVKSRKAMIEWITDDQNSGWQMAGGYPFAFDVKCYPNFEFDNIKKIFIEKHGISCLNQIAQDHLDEFFELAEKDYNEETQCSLWEVVMETLQENVKNDEAITCVPGVGDEWKYLKIEFDWAGRSGGYLCLAKFNGWNMKGFLNADDFDSWTYQELTDLYRWLWLAIDMFTRKAAKDEAEYVAAEDYFVNYCWSVTEAMKKRREEEAALHEAAITYAMIGE